MWVVTTGVEQARALLADTTRFSKESALLRGAIRAQLAKSGDEVRLSEMYGPSMMYADGADHARLRRLVARNFNAARVEMLRPRVRELTAHLLAAVPVEVPVDLVGSFTFRLPITVLCELLGLPLEDRDEIHEWTTALVLDDRDRTVPSSDALAGYLERQIARVRAKPDAGLLSGLVHASVDGDALTADELMAQLFLLVVSGHETTSGLIANTMYALLVQPERWRGLVADPTLARAALDETLRYDAPVRNATHRVTREAVEFGGTTVPAGEILLVSLSAAGRDPGTTDDAAEFDLHRTVRHHVAFGHGPHHCPGQQLALVQAETALTALATGFPNTRLLDASPPRSQSSILSGITELTLVLA
ncbi:cytochrome P450 [Lentzea sp. NPDC060358]|uniref:cytochrome P450 n=1 Tax=Lentzea sp. NPDC060358 TaxID=3347103 RepID=UPI003653739C